jgi:hypothetical protein
LGDFDVDDGIIVPRVYTKLSTARVLTMELIGGVHIDRYLARNPAQDERNDFGQKIFRSLYRLMYVGRLMYADFHPGNFLFLNDGRLGVIDFGYVTRISDEIWEFFRKVDRPLTTGRREDRIVAVKEWSWLTDDSSDADRVRLGEAMTDWYFLPRYCGGEFDFGDEAYFRRGIELCIEMARKRYNRGRSITPTITRQMFGMWSLLYRLKAKVDVRAIAEEEVKATGWDRSEYAA